ncbi:MAG: riboflavin synthase [Polyangiaceae bacterium]
MFTGLVEETGFISAKQMRGKEARLRIACTMGVGALAPGGALALGESISVSGACLTVVAIHSDGFEIDASAETLARTTLGGLTRASAVNLERAMQLGGRMGGHLVTGHVDGVGALVGREASGDSQLMTFSFPAELARFIAEKGSVCVSGVSLTVNAVGSDSFGVTIIPHTLKMTTLGALAANDRVNLEIDLVARYVLRAGDVTAHGDRSGDLGAALERAGYKT